MGKVGRLAAVAAALGAAAALYGAIIFGSRAGPLADLTHYKYWTRLVTVEGLHAAYRGEYPQTYAIYPPVTLVTFLVAGVLYERSVDPTFDLDRALASHTLSVLIRLQALAFHLLVGLAVFGVVWHATRVTHVHEPPRADLARVAPEAAAQLPAALRVDLGFGTAYAAMLAYLFNPGVLFDVAQWGQPDPIFGLFVLLALAAAAWGASVSYSVSLPRGSWLERIGLVGGARLLRVTAFGVRGGGPLPAGAAAAAGLCIALAALAKPQAWVFLPLVAAVVWRRGGLRGLCWAAAAGAAAGTLVALPYLMHGTLRQLLGLPRAIASVMPVVTANAHNLWWFFTDGAARWYLDQEPVLGPLSFRLAGMALAGTCAVLALARAGRQPTFGAVFTAGAYTGFGFFMGMTQIHENHLYVMFPLLAVAAATDRRLWGIYAVLALTWCANMLLHDFDLAETVVAPLLPWTLREAHWANAAVNTLVFAVWTAWLTADTWRAWSWRRPPAGKPRRPAATILKRQEAPKAMPDDVAARAERFAARLLDDETLRRDLTDDEFQPLLDWALGRLHERAATLPDPALEEVTAGLRAALRAANDALGQRYDLAPEAFAARLAALADTLRPPLYATDAAAAAARAAVRARAADLAARKDTAEGGDLAADLAAALAADEAEAG